MDAPLCRQCGGLFTNPAATQCRFCGMHVMAAPAMPMAPYRPAAPYPPHAPYPPYAYAQAVRAGGQTSFFWLRIAVIAIAIVMSVVGACVSAFAGG